MKPTDLSSALGVQELRDRLRELSNGLTRQSLKSWWNRGDFSCRLFLMGFHGGWAWFDAIIHLLIYLIIHVFIYLLIYFFKHDFIWCLMFLLLCVFGLNHFMVHHPAAPRNAAVKLLEGLRQNHKTLLEQRSTVLKRKWELYHWDATTLPLVKRYVCLYTYIYIYTHVLYIYI